MKFSQILAVFLILIGSVASLFAASIEDGDTVRTKKLYSCYFFFNAAAESGGKSKDEKMAQVAERFLMKATIMAVKSGGIDRQRKLTREAATEYQEFSSKLSETRTERDDQITRFLDSCKEALQTSDTPDSTAQQTPEEALQKGDYASALRLLLPLAEGGNPQAQTNLGAMYAAGQGVERDSAKAFYWTRKGAEGGNAKAQANLGLMYFYGNGVEQNDEQAVNWLRKAVAQGNTGAQSTLGILYLDGRGVPSDYTKARELFTAAMNAGEVGAANNLARMIETGRGCPPDLKAALELYEIAAKHGNASAQNRVGLAFLNGELREKNVQAAKSWFEKAAEQGEMYAMYHYGMLLFEDKPLDPIPGLKWIALSAQQGHAPAQQRLDKDLPALTLKQQNQLKKLVAQWRPKGTGAMDPSIRWKGRNVSQYEKTQNLQRVLELTRQGQKAD